MMQMPHFVITKEKNVFASKIFLFVKNTTRFLTVKDVTQDLKAEEYFCILLKRCLKWPK